MSKWDMTFHEEAPAEYIRRPLTLNCNIIPHTSNFTPFCFENVIQHAILKNIEGEWSGQIQQHLNLTKHRRLCIRSRIVPGSNHLYKWIFWIPWRAHSFNLRRPFQMPTTFASYFFQPSFSFHEADIASIWKGRRIRIGTHIEVSKNSTYFFQPSFLFCEVNVVGIWKGHQRLNGCACWGLQKFAGLDYAEVDIELLE